MPPRGGSPSAWLVAPASDDDRTDLPCDPAPGSLTHSRNRWVVSTGATLSRKASSAEQGSGCDVQAVPSALERKVAPPPSELAGPTNQAARACSSIWPPWAGRLAPSTTCQSSVEASVR